MPNENLNVVGSLLLILFLVSKVSLAECVQPSAAESSVRSIKDVILGSFGANQCDLAADTGFPQLKGGLSPLWAQEQIGADLAKDYMAGLERNGKNLQTVTVADIDAGFQGHIQADLTGPKPAENLERFGLNGPYGVHGTQVSNLIAGKGNFGVGYKAKILPLSYFESSSSQTPFSAATEKAMKSDADIINLETHTLNTLNQGTDFLTYDKSELENFLPENSRKKLIVAAAGNYYGYSTGYEKNENLKEVILVGSANEEGIVSSFSDESPDVTLLAPSDYTLTSPSGTSSKFGGTSGATPLVSGALANVLSIISPLEPLEAKMLLQKTATPLPATKISKKNGAGLLNAYKLVRVAERLKEKGWPENKQALEDGSLYDFSEESESEFQKAVALLSKKPRTCSDMKTVKNHLRKSFLLNPTTKNSQTLALVLAAGGYPRDAQMYAIRTKENLEFQQILWNQAKKIHTGPPTDMTLLEAERKAHARSFMTSWDSLKTYHLLNKNFH